MDDSYIQTGAGGISFVGPDAVNLYRAMAIRSALGLGAKGIQVKPGLSRKRLLAMASEYTKRPYLNTQDGIVEAQRDLKKWADEMAAALPRENRDETV